MEQFTLIIANLIADCIFVGSIFLVIYAHRCRREAFTKEIREYAFRDMRSSLIANDMPAGQYAYWYAILSLKMPDIVADLRRGSDWKSDVRKNVGSIFQENVFPTQSYPPSMVGALQVQYVCLDLLYF